MGPTLELRLGIPCAPLALPTAVLSALGRERATTIGTEPGSGRLLDGNYGSVLHAKLTFGLFHSQSSIDTAIDTSTGAQSSAVILMSNLKVPVELNTSRQRLGKEGTAGISIATNRLLDSKHSIAEQFQV